MRIPPTPLSREAFRTAYHDVLTDMDRHIAHTPLLDRLGWCRQLEGYRWGGKETTWGDGVAAREANAIAVQAYRAGQASHREVFAQIVNTWGGIRQALPETWEPRIRATMAALEARPDHLDATALCGGRIASVSKLYAAMAPETWVIYDSRVAAALTYLIAATGHQMAKGADWGVLPAKTPWRLRMLSGFRRIYPRKDPGIQPLAFQSFAYASWSCQALAATLNARNEPLPNGELGGWKAYHVEMVLFMLGRDLHDLPAVSAAGR